MVFRHNNILLIPLKEKEKKYYYDALTSDKCVLCVCVSSPNYNLINLFEV